MALPHASERGRVYGDDVWSLSEAPPDGARAYNAMDGPAWLLQNNLADVLDFNA